MMCVDYLECPSRAYIRRRYWMTIKGCSHIMPSTLVVSDRVPTPVSSFSFSRASPDNLTERTEDTRLRLQFCAYDSQLNKASKARTMVSMHLTRTYGVLRKSERWSSILFVAMPLRYWTSISTTQGVYS